MLSLPWVYSLPSLLERRNGLLGPQTLYMMANVLYVVPSEYGRAAQGVLVQLQ